MRKVHIILCLLFDILLTLTVSHTCCMEVIAWNNSELSNIAYAFNSAMCRIYNVSLKLLPTVRVLVFILSISFCVTICLVNNRFVL